MAKSILTAATPATQTHQYRLPEADRQAILAQSSSARLDRKIQKQYTEFCKNNNGSPLGQESDRENEFSD